MIIQNYLISKSHFKLLEMSDKTMNFGIIDSWKIEEKTKKIQIRFSSEFLEMMRGQGFFKFIDFTEFKKLDSPLATRLYEILCKSFYIRNVWEIDAIKLANKIPLAQKFASDIIKKITAAINRINKHTDLDIKLAIRYKERGKAILIFTKRQAEKEDKVSGKHPTINSIIDDELTRVLQTLPEGKQKQKTIIEIVQKFYKEFGSDYVIRNIKYARKYAKQNFRQYLYKALKEDWGIVVEEDEEERALQFQLLKIKEKQEVQQVKSDQAEKAEQQELEQKAKDYIADLAGPQLEELREEALNKLDPKIVDYLLSGAKSASGIAARITLKTKMEAIIRERLAFR